MGSAPRHFNAALAAVKSYYPAVTLAVIGACAALAARASLHVFEARYLPPPSPPPVVSAARRPAPARPAHGKDPTAILERNIFCSACPPILARPAAPVADDKAGQETRSDLPLKLLATVTAVDPRDSFGIVQDTRAAGTNRNAAVKVLAFGTYSRGDHVAGSDAVVDHVDDRRLYFKVADHLEYLEVAASTWPDRPNAPGRGPGPAPIVARPPARDPRRGVRRVSETKFEIERAALEAVLANSGALARSARVVPSVSPRNGRPDGFKLYAIRPDSLYSLIGLQNGDTVAAVNGQALDSPMKAFELYAKLRTASSLQLAIVRRGRPMTIDYSIR